MRTITLKAVVASAAVVLLAAVGLATAGVPFAKAPRTARAAKAHAVHARLSAFKQAFRPTRAQIRERAEIRREFRKAPASATVASADFGTARPAVIAGTNADVWIAPSADGGVCTFIPDPQGGYGSSCASAAEVQAGHAVTMLGGGSAGPLTDSAIVAVVEPDGAAEPVAIGRDGVRSSLRISSNVATGIVKLGDTVISGANSIAVPSATTKGCAEAQAGDPFRRCG